MTFHLFQRVKVARVDNPPNMYTALKAGMEGVIVEIGRSNYCGEMFDYGFLADNDRREPFCVYTHELEPLRHEPDAFELMTQENAPEAPCRVPDFAMGKYA